jgi:hypothetical protein
MPPAETAMTQLRARRQLPVLKHRFRLSTLNIEINLYGVPSGRPASMMRVPGDK